MRRSDMAWYCRNDPEEAEFYTIFFDMCRKYHISWASASEKERYFVAEVSRVTFEIRRAHRLGIPVSSVRPAFS